MKDLSEWTSIRVINRIAYTPLMPNTVHRVQVLKQNPIHPSATLHARHLCRQQPEPPGFSAASMDGKAQMYKLKLSPVIIHYILVTSNSISILQAQYAISMMTLRE
jgi:hypothetical protein